MLNGLLNHVRLTARAKTGISTAMVICGVLASIASLMAMIFFLFAAFIWLAERYNALTAALVLAGGFLLFAILAALGAVMAQRRTIETAKRALAARSQSSLLDPGMIGVALQVGKTIGLRRIVPLAAAGFLAATLAKEWFRNRSAGADIDGDEEDA